MRYLFNSAGQFKITVGAELRGLRITGGQTGMINEGDAICATESERVVGFNAITCGAAFHVWNVAIETMR